MEGVTRDRLYQTGEIFGKTFEMIDTGGIRISDKEDIFQDEITLQATLAIEEADSIIMVVDGVIGVTALDRHVASLLLKQGKKVTLAVNKVDSEYQEPNVFEFYKLGIDSVFGVSALHGNNVAELLESAIDGIDIPEEVEAETRTQVAIVGRPNVGKSTLINFLSDEHRCVVSPEAGTTRDSIDVQLEYGEEKYTLVDTAGIRKKKGEHCPVDKFAANRTEKAIERSDVCLLVLDAAKGLTAHDKRIAAMIEESGKGCVLLFNKWDTVKGFRMEHCRQALLKEAPFLAFCPMLFISAHEGRNVEKIYEKIDQVKAFMHERISTGKLNSFVSEMMHKYHPPMIKGKRLRIYYLTQITSHPPRFLLFVNYKELMSETYKKYLINRFRETFGFDGVPIAFILRDKNRTQQRQTKAIEPKHRALSTRK